MDHPIVYALIINWNGMEHVHACFETLLRCPYPGLRAVLVDNGSSDGSPEYVEQTFANDPRVAVWRLERNLGWGGGNNQGLRGALKAGADFVFLLNNDTWTDVEAIPELLSLARQRPSAGAIAPKMLLFDTPSVVNSFGVTLSPIGAAWDTGAGRADGPGYGDVREVAAVCGGAMFLRADALRKAGLIDEQFGIYYDDVDLCLRIWQAGYTCVTCPTARVGHKFSASFASREGQRRKEFLMERNRIRCLCLNFPARTMFRHWLTIKAAGLRVLGRAILDRQWWRTREILRAWISFMGQCPDILRKRKGRFSVPYEENLERLLHTEQLFCPGILLPRHGVYPAQEIDGVCWNPVAPGFQLPCANGELRASVANCYRRTTHTGTLAALGMQTARNDGVRAWWDGTTLGFESDDVLPAEASHQPYDTGGYLRLEFANGEWLDAYPVIVITD